MSYDTCIRCGASSQDREAIHALRARLAACEEAWKAIGVIIESAPELNVSNYDHDQVCELNAKMVEAVLFHRSALKEPSRG